MCHFGWDIGATKWMGIGEVCDVDGGTRRTMGHGVTTDAPANVITAIQQWTQASLVSANFQSDDHTVERYCSFAGSVDDVGVVAAWPNRPSWVGYPLGRCLFETSGQAQRIADDGICAAIGEHRYGVARVARDFLYVTLGTGVGSGLFIDGQVRQGAYPSLSLGHVRIGGDAVCSCGRVGCLQTVFSGRQFVDHGTRGGFIEPDGDSDSVGSLVRVASDIAGFLGLEAIVVTGGLVGYWPTFASDLVARLEESLADTRCAVALSRFPHLSAAYGALALSYGSAQSRAAP